MTEGGVGTLPDSFTLEGLDFEPSYVCEHSQHGRKHPGDEPAVVHLVYRCPACGHSGAFMMCGPGLAWYVSTWVRCSGSCDKSSPGADWVVRTVPVGVER